MNQLIESSILTLDNIFLIENKDITGFKISVEYVESI